MDKVGTRPHEEGARSRADGLEKQLELRDLLFEAILVRGWKDRRIRYWNRGAERLFGLGGPRPSAVHPLICCGLITRLL
jgi:hypothetical protein